MDPDARVPPADSVVLTGAGRASAGPEPVDARPWLKSRKSAKFMGLQDRLAVVAAGRALESAGLAGVPLGERTGLYLAVGHIPFEKEDLDAILGASVVEGRLSMRAFSTAGFDSVSPLLTFRCLPNMPAYHVSANFDVQGPYFVTYPGAGQLYLALEEAVSALGEGRADIALVGGVAHQRNHLVTHHFRRLLPPVPGADLEDAAGLLVLETEAHAAGRGATIRGRIDDLLIEYRPHDPFEPPANTSDISAAEAAAPESRTVATRDGYLVECYWRRP